MILSRVVNIVLRPVVPDGVRQDYICVPTVDYDGDEQ